MDRRYTIVFDDRRARTIESLAREYELTEREVIQQVLDIGFDQLELERTTA